MFAFAIAVLNWLTSRFLNFRFLSHIAQQTTFVMVPPLFLIFLVLAIVALLAQGISMEVVVQGLTGTINNLVLLSVPGFGGLVYGLSHIGEGGGGSVDPVAVAVIAGALMGLQEYARSRAGNAGMGEVGVVTVWERPTRVIVTAAFLLGAGIYASAAGAWATWGAWAWLGLGVVGLVQLLVVVRRRLSSD